MNSIYDISVTRIDGTPTTLRQWEGQVLLIVNVASQCGFTKQYTGLQEVHTKYTGKGFSVLGFPCNQFGGQEPGSNEEIQESCKLNFGVTFPLFSKIEVNGPGTHPLFAHLKTKQRGILGTEDIKWNFTKFLVGRDGTVLERYASTTTPQAIEADIEKALGEGKQTEGMGIPVLV